MYAGYILSIGVSTMMLLTPQIESSKTIPADQFFPRYYRRESMGIYSLASMLCFQSFVAVYTHITLS
jgi:hypothetical protein